VNALTRRRGVDRERSFGVSVGPVLMVIATVLAWRGRTTSGIVLGAFGAVLLVCGLTRPSLLKRPSDVWWRFAHVLGWFNSRVLLVAIYVLLIVPIAFVWRLMGKDPLRLRRRDGSGWQAYPARYRDPQHYRRMF